MNYLKCNFEIISWKWNKFDRCFRLPPITKSFWTIKKSFKKKTLLNFTFDRFISTLGLEKYWSSCYLCNKSNEYLESRKFNKVYIKGYNFI